MNGEVNFFLIRDDITTLNWYSVVERLEMNEPQAQSGHVTINTIAAVK